MPDLRPVEQATPDMQDPGQKILTVTVGGDVSDADLVRGLNQTLLRDIAYFIHVEDPGNKKEANTSV